MCLFFLSFGLLCLAYLLVVSWEGAFRSFYFWICFAWRSKGRLGGTCSTGQRVSSIGNTPQMDLILSVEDLLVYKGNSSSTKTL